MHGNDREINHWLTIASYNRTSVCVCNVYLRNMYQGCGVCVSEMHSMHFRHTEYVYERYEVYIIFTSASLCPSSDGSASATMTWKRRFLPAARRNFSMIAEYPYVRMHSSACMCSWACSHIGWYTLSTSSYSLHARWHTWLHGIIENNEKTWYRLIRRDGTYFHLIRKFG